MFGDSISALWPTEQLHPFVPVKVAFPFRTSKDILDYASQERGYYDACIYNGGMNDFLGNYTPSELLLEDTINNQLKTIEILRMKCKHMLAINTWNVYFPWPIEAAIKLNTKMKQRILEIPRLDTETLITEQMLLDGGHLNERGYQVLSNQVMNHYQTIYPILSALKKK